MPQREGETDYKYEDYASEMATHRLPQTSALVRSKMKITLDSGTVLDLDFVDRNKVAWKSGGEGGTDWCEAVEVAPKTYFIDMTFGQKPRESHKAEQGCKNEAVVHMGLHYSLFLAHPAE